jgi:hypothetical protein
VGGKKGGSKKSANMQLTINTTLFLCSESIAIMFTIIQLNKNFETISKQT